MSPGWEGRGYEKRLLRRILRPEMRKLRRAREPRG
jgi:hypothetical protein